MRLLAVSLMFFSLSAFAAPADRLLTCTLSYQIQVAPGQVKYVTPANGDKQVRLYKIDFCTNGTNCVKKEIGSAFLGSSEIGGASIRIVGDKATIVLRDAAGNRSAMMINSAGLQLTEAGAPIFMLNSDGWYNGELMTAIIYSCLIN